MKATDYLKTHHREIESLFEQIEEADGREKKSLFAELAEKFDAHAKIEETIFYPAGRGVDEDMTLEAYEEHAVTKAAIKKILKTRVNDETYMAKITVLKEMIEHHVEEEEEEFFPECEQKLGDEKMQQLGEELEEAYEKRLGRKPSPRKSAKGSHGTYAQAS